MSKQYIGRVDMPINHMAKTYGRSGCIYTYIYIEYTHVLHMMHVYDMHIKYVDQHMQYN